MAHLGGWVLILGACLASAGCQVHKPIVKLHDIEVSGVDHRKLDVVFVFKAVNPNGFAIKFRTLAYDAFVHGDKFADGLIGQAVELAAHEETLVRAPVTVEYRKLLSVVRQSKSSGDELDYEMRCRATFDVIGFAVTVPTVHRGRLPRPPSLHFRTVRMDRQSGVIEVVLDITNNSGIELPVVGVSGHLKLGGQTLLEIQPTSATTVQPYQTAQAVIPVRVGPEDVARLAAAIARRDLKFEGELKLSAPASLRKMLLGID